MCSDIQNQYLQFKGENTVLLDGAETWRTTVKLDKEDDVLHNKHMPPQNL